MSGTQVLVPALGPKLPKKCAAKNLISFVMLWIKLYLSGYVYLLFDSEKAVRSLLQECTHDYSSGEYYFNISSRRMRSKEVILFEVLHNKTSKMTCAQHPPSLRVFAVCMKKHWAHLTTCWAHIGDSAQTGWMPGLIWVFTERTCNFVGFVVWRLIFYTGLELL